MKIKDIIPKGFPINKPTIIPNDKGDEIISINPALLTTMAVLAKANKGISK